MPDDRSVIVEGKYLIFTFHFFLWPFKWYLRSVYTFPFGITYICIIEKVKFDTFYGFGIESRILFMLYVWNIWNIIR